MRKIICFALLILGTGRQLPAQTISPFTLNVAGGSYNSTASYNRYEWSFGESMVITLMASSDSAVIVTHGILQPCTDKPGNSPDISFFGVDEYRLFPNPTTAKFELNFFIRQSGRMVLRLVDVTGRLLEERNYPYNGCCRVDQFDLGKYTDGLYYIMADLEPSNHSKTRHGGFKVIKLKD